MRAQQKAIVQEFAVPFARVRAAVPLLAAAGFTHVQLSPVQPHCAHVRGWTRLYQPTGEPAVGNSLGGESDLVALIEALHAAGMGLVVDVVLHHTCGCPLCSAAPMRSLQWAADAACAWAACLWTGPGAKVYERFNMKDWGPRQQVDVGPVLALHTVLLRKLLSLGADGFRFDACKHIPPPYFTRLFEAVGIRDGKDSRTGRELLIYGEALDGDPRVLNEYTGLMHMLDFPLTFTMAGALAPGGDVRQMARDTISQWRAVPLADCHDSVLGSSYRFGDDTDAVLAACFLLARGAGVPLVYGGRAEDHRVRAALQFFQLLAGEGFCIRADSTRTLLLLTRGSRGLCVLNKAGEWACVDAFTMHGMRDGVWRELVCGFDVRVRGGWVEEWGAGSGHGGMRVGPRSLLLLVAQV
eukprot:TRINITY_DN2667_c0_g1_i1.p1 TRINITY_DN2667_c0_g1~~TRINITY_DN2667_c0_g1_i1.p1  ORF type:complete len:411 (+),score=117.69 TRINITY_DN2667_c0_g1_i1:147-1379(+)